MKSNYDGVMASSHPGVGDREIREMLMHVVCPLVDHPDDVEIVLISDAESAVFCIQAHPKDLDQLIGRGGQTARSLRTIVNACGMKLGRRLSVDFVEKASRTQ